MTYLLLGSNLRDILRNIIKAIHLINDFFHVSRISSLYLSEPVGIFSNNIFMNCALEVYTAGTPQQILAITQEIEKQLEKKVLKPHLCPRVIDIDILLIDDLVISEENLIVPHPRMHQRKFVLAPLAEIAPNLQHPILKKNISQLLKELNCNAFLYKIGSLREVISNVYSKLY